MKPSNYSIAETEQVKALAAPTRQEILDTLESNGPATVATLGELLGRAPDSLYHHIRILLRAGLVRRVEPAPGTSPRGAVYDLPGYAMSIAYRLEDPAMTEAIGAVVRSMSRISYHDFARALARRDAVVEGAQRNLRSARKKAWLDASQIEAINRHFHAIFSIMSTWHQPGAETKLHAVTFMMSPIGGHQDGGAPLDALREPTVDVERGTDS